MLKQGQFQPMVSEKKVVVLYAATKGYLDKKGIRGPERVFPSEYPVSLIESFEQKLLKEIDPGILKTISEQRTVSE